MHTLFFPDLTPDSDTLTVEGDEARHAVRVKRLNPGERVRILNGQGLVAFGVAESLKGKLTLKIVERAIALRVSPAVHVWSATPKGPRISELIETLVQVGAASWTPMSTSLGVADPRDSKLDRLTRISVEAAKQAQRPWLLDINSKSTLEAALRGPGVILCDASGDSYSPSGHAEIRVLIGPEGGFTPKELSAARSAEATVVSLGPHVMRIETAAPVAVAIILHAERHAATPSTRRP